MIAMLIRSCGQVLHQVDEAHALLPEQVLGGHLDVGERQFGGVLRIQPDLVQVAATLEALHAALDDEQREALRALVGIRARDDDHQVGVDAVGDEGLGSVEHPAAVFLLDGTGLDALEVTAGSGFRHCDRRDDLPRAESGQPTLLLLFGGQAQEVGRDDVVLQREAQAAESARGGLLGDDHVVAEVVVPAAAVLLRHGHAEEALLAGFEPDATIDDLVLFPLLVERRDVALEECAIGLAEQLVLGFEEGALVLDYLAGRAHG